MLRRVLMAVLAVIFSVSTFAQSGNNGVPDYQPVTGKQRVEWFVTSAAGPTSLLAAGPVSAGWGTAFNKPKEYGPHWEGFAQRYGMRLTGISTGDAIEGGLGAIWGEDPRYFRSPNNPFGKRVLYVIKATFLAPNREGQWRPAYARYAGNVGNNFLSNTWRVPSESGAGDAALRCVWGVTGEMASDALIEFWPDLKKYVFHIR